MSLYSELREYMKCKIMKRLRFSIIIIIIIMKVIGTYFTDVGKRKKATNWLLMVVRK